MIISFAFCAFLTFIGMLIAAKITGFHILTGQIAIVAGISTALGLIPGYGWALSLLSTFALLKFFSSGGGLFLMCIVSWISCVLTVTALNQFFGQLLT